MSSLEKKVSRRSAMAGGLGLAMGSLWMTDAVWAEGAAAPAEVAWKYTKLCPKAVAKSAYESFTTRGCMYGAFKGAMLVYADQIEKSDSAQAAAARAFPFLAFQSGRSGCGKLKSLCGAVSGAAAFMGLFVEDWATLTALIQKLGQYASETALPEYKPENDPYKDFPTAVAHGVSCKEMGSAWMGIASDEYKKIVGERCKRHTASIMAHAVEILNEHFEESSKK